MLVQKLDEADLSLAMILNDPILCVEFLRNTKDGSMNKDLWPKKEPFKYRGYQRDLLTDQHPYISLTGGRSIGKCQVGWDRVLTEHGYRYFYQIINKTVRVWAFDGEKLVLRRAHCIYNNQRITKTIYMESGDLFTATLNHPVWTPGGWKLVEDLEVGDRIGRVGKIPHVASLPYAEEEARLMGYFYKLDTIKKVFYPNKAVKEDIKRCAAYIGVTFVDEGDHLKLTKGYELLRKFQTDYMLLAIYKPSKRAYKKLVVPFILEMLPEESLREFFSAFLAKNATISKNEISFYVPTSRMATKFRELFLRFGIQTRTRDRIDTIDTGIGYSHRRECVNVEVHTLSKEDVQRAFRDFKIPGYVYPNLPEVENVEFFWDTVQNITKGYQRTYLLQVEKDHTYISEDLIMHNSLVLEDKLLFNIVNNEEELIEVPQMLLATANQNQMTQVIDNLNMRCLSSPLLRGFIKGAGLNKQKGVMDFDFNGRDVRLHTRIAGSRAENNMVGLHLNKIYVDEA